MAGDRAIVAERALEVVSKQLDVTARHNTTLQITLDNSVAKETSLLRTLSVNTHVDEDSAINTLSHILMTKGVTVPLQNLANQVIQHCLKLNKSNDGVFLLKQSIGRALKYKRVGRERSLKTNAKPLSRKRWIQKIVSQMLGEVEGWDQDLVIQMLKALGRKLGLFFAKHDELQMSVAESVVLRDHVGTGTNGLYRMKQAIEFFCPALKGFILPTNIRRHVSLMERDGVIPSRLVQVC